MIKDKDEMRSKLESVEKITYSFHFESRRLPFRDNITKEMLERHLRNPENLITFEYQEDKHKGEKYSLLFKKSNKYDIKAVVSFKNKSLNIVTAHIQSKKKRNKFKKGFKGF